MDFFGVRRPDLPRQREQPRLVFRLKGLAAQICDPADIVRGHEGQNVLHHGLVKRLAVGKVPGLGVEAVLAVVPAPGHEQTHPHPPAHWQYRSS